MWTAIPAKDKPLHPCTLLVLHTTHLSKEQAVPVPPIPIRTPITPAPTVPTSTPRRGVKRNTSRALLELQGHPSDSLKATVSLTPTRHRNTTLLRPTTIHTPQRRSRDRSREQDTSPRPILVPSRKPNRSPCRHHCPRPLTLHNPPRTRHCTPDRTRWIRPARRLRRTASPLSDILVNSQSLSQPLHCLSPTPLRCRAPRNTSRKSTSQWPWNRHRRSAVHRASDACVTSGTCGRSSICRLQDAGWILVGRRYRYVCCH